MNDTDIARLALSVGLPQGNPVAFAVAIALCESSGNPNAVGPRTRYGSAVGLWQIMPPGDNGESGASLKNPQVNARAMASRSRMGTNWQPWECWTSGKWKRFYERGIKAASAASGPNLPGGLENTLSGSAFEGVQAVDAVGDATAGALGSIATLADVVTNPDWWKRIGVGAAGVALVVVAGVLVLKDVVPSPAGVVAKLKP